MAIRAANFAFGELILEAKGTAAAAHEPRYMFRFTVNMIELENEAILFAAIHTPCVREKTQNDRMIASIRGGTETRQSCVDLPLLDAAVVCCSRSRCVVLVTVRAQYLAFCDLVEDTAAGATEPNEVGNIRILGLWIYVVELQHHRIRNAAPDARVHPQIVKYRRGNALFLKRSIPPVAGNVGNVI